MLFFIFLSAAAAVLSALLLKVAFQPRRLWPPGPPAWPIIGHLHLLGDLPHQTLASLSKLYGPLMGLRFGCVPTVVVSSPAMAKEILQIHDLAFTYRPRCAAGVHMGFDCTDMVFAPYGPYWKLLRQLFVTELFSSKRLEASRHIREEEIRALTRFLAQSVQEKPQQAAMELRASLLAASNGINCRMTLGKRITGAGDHGMSRKEDLLNLVAEMMHLAGAFYVGDFIPWMAWFDPHRYLKRMEAVGQKIKELMQGVIDERRAVQRNAMAVGGEVREKDLLDVLMDAAASPAESHIAITDDNIKAILTDIFTGGSDTSTLTIEWALADLVNNPEVMQKVQEELDTVVGRERLVEENDISNLPYLGVVLKESMRLHPIAPLLIPREASVECFVGGYKIPKKTRVYVNTWAIGRDPTVWKKPLDFWPDRFLDNNIGLHGQSFEFLPFGFGRRKCSGWAMGALNVHLFLASLVQGFTWSHVPLSTLERHFYTQHLDMSEKFGLTLEMARPLSLFFTPRLSIDLY